MAPEIKTSFIPKKAKTSTGPRQKSSVGLVMVGALVIFFSSLVIAGGLYLYRVLLTTQIENMREDVEIAKQEIQPRLIDLITRFDKRITIAEALIEEHFVMAPLFYLLEKQTLPNVRYNRFFAGIDDSGNVILSLSGEAETYKDLALQSDIFGRDENITSPIFSGLRLNALGNVSFRFSGRISPSLLLFGNNLEPPIESEISSEPLEE